MISLAQSAGENAVKLSWDTANPGATADSHTCGFVSVNLTEFDVYSGEEGLSVAQQGSEGTYLWGWHLWGPDISQKVGGIHASVKASYIREINDIATAVRPAAQAIASVKISVHATPEHGRPSTLAFVPALLRQTAEQSSNDINNTIASTYADMTNSSYGNKEVMTDQGWGAAGLWYSNIGKINQKYMEAVSSAVPTLDTLFAADAVDENARWGIGRWLGRSRYGINGNQTTEIEQAVAFAYDEYAEHIAAGVPESSPLYQESRLESANSDAESKIARTVLMIFGAQKLYDVKDNPNLDPMARITAGGHSIVNGALIAFGVGAAATAGSLVAGDNPTGNLLGGVSKLLFVIASIGLVAGVMLAYVLPLMPFVYFSFAVIGWVLEIFEAIVAMPLWALAHLRIDGDGMPGAAAIGGYQLLLMILLRPTMIVIGLIGGYIIFGAAMYYFTTLFNSAVSITRDELVGGETRFMGVMVYTLIYVFLAYNLALMCFKMIDDVPKGIMRWMGASVQPFSDSRGDPIQGSREIIIGTVAGGSALAGGLSRSLQGDDTGRGGMARSVGQFMQRRASSKPGKDGSPPE